VAGLPDELDRAFRAARDDADPLRALKAIATLRDALGRWETQIARNALAKGETWETIGAALGISRQAAWERLRRGVGAAIEADRAHLEARRQALKERNKRG
jgi:biotin operon repressor